MKKPRCFCPYCAKPIIQKDTEGKIRDCCNQCNIIFYDNPLPVACSIVVNDAREVLLVKRKKDPYKDMWCLPIGFAEADEEVKDAALRELTEETGLTGQIVRLIDVDTIDNYFYGSLAIVTYEVKMTGGTLCPGDDADDAKFIPIMDLPKLAWSSNEKAIKIYLDLHHDAWAMIDSFKQLFPEDSMTEVSTGVQQQRKFLSNILVKIIDTNSDDIIQEWTQELQSGIQSLNAHIDFLVGVNKKVLRIIRNGLKGKKRASDFLEFLDTGRDLNRLGVTLPDILNALALSRKHIWMYVIKKKILLSPLEIYITLELNNRIIFLYDKINYFMTAGYLDQKEVIFRK